MLASSLTTGDTHRARTAYPALAAHAPAVAAAPARPPAADPLAILEATATTVSVEKEQTIYAEGSPAEFCYRIVCGCVRMVKLMEDGRRHVAEFLLPGDLVGFDTLGTYDLSAEAVGSVVLHRYRRGAVERLADSDPATARRLRVLTASGLRAAWERMVLLGRKTAVERIASFLLEMADRLPGGGRQAAVLPMGRLDIADHLGLTMETVCRVLSGLRQDGTIGMSRSVNGTQVTIRDPAGLQALACARRH